MSDDAAALSDVAQSALAQAINDHDHAMLIKYVALCEVIETSGERAMWILATDGMKPWESIGLIEYAHDLERAATNRDQQ